MALRMIYGEAGTGKSEYCFQTMLDLHKKGIKSLMIVPEQFAHSAELALVQKNGFLSDDISATSFKRLAQKQLQKSGLLKGSLSKIGKSMLLAKAILSVSADLTLYKRAAERPGFVDVMLQFIDDCKRSAVSPKQLAELDLPENSYFSLKMSELALIYGAYQKAVDEGFTDREDYLTYLAEYVGQTAMFRGVHIFIDEFFCFTKAELDCIRAFMLAGAEVWVTLGCGGPCAGGIFEPVQKTGAALYAMAKDAGILVADAVILKGKHRFAASAELAHFEQAYPSYLPSVYEKPTENVSLYIAPDLYTEVQALAAAICRTVSERGLHYRDVAVIAGNRELYGDLIKTVFPVYQIPVFVDQNRPLLSHPIIVMLFSLLDLVTKGIETETLLAYAKTGYSGLSREETDKLENFALSGRLRRQDWLDEKRFLERSDSVFYDTENYEERNAEDAAALLAVRQRLLTPLLSLRDALAGSRHVTDRAAALVAFFEDIGLYKTVQEELSAMESRGDLQQAHQHGEIYNLLIELLDELVLCLGEEKIGMQRLSAIISAGLAQCEISTIPPGGDQVIFGDESRSLIKNVKALFVIGANDNAFPASPPQEGVLRDDERRSLAECGISLGPDGQTVAFHNQYAVYNALCIASESMYVSYAVADHDGKGLRPSPLIQRLKKMFPSLLICDDLLEKPPAKRLVAGKASAWQYMLEHFHEKTPEVTALHKLFSEDASYAAAYEALQKHLAEGKQSDDLSQSVARALYGTELRGSVSQLELYRKCPFYYFMQYGLRAKERKVLQIDAPDIGNLLHKLVEIASLRLHQRGESFGTLRDAAVAADLAEAIVEEQFASLFIAKLYSEKRLAALVRRMKRLVTKFLVVLGEHVARGEFEPFAFEAAFDENGDLPPVKLSLPTGETIILRGRIDRIDILKQEGKVYIKIIDYKSFDKSFSLSDVYNNLSLQLAVYLMAATEGGAEQMGGKPLPAGMFYFRLVDKMVAAEEADKNALLKQFKMSGLLLQDVDIVRAMDRGISGYSEIVPAYIKNDGTFSESGTSGATLEQFDKLAKRVRRVAGEIGREIMQGRSQIMPCKGKSGLPCSYCVYHSVCGFDPEVDDYTVVSPLKNDAVWELLEKEE